LDDQNYEKYYQYENFEVTVLDLILNKKRMNEYVGLSEYKLAKLLLDFYDKIKSRDLKYIIHPCHLVLVISVDNEY
jgi:hypothetical protein